MHLLSEMDLVVYIADTVLQLTFLSQWIHSYGPQKNLSPFLIKVIWLLFVTCFLLAGPVKVPIEAV